MKAESQCGASWRSNSLLKRVVELEAQIRRRYKGENCQANRLSCDTATDSASEHRGSRVLRSTR